MHSVGKKKPNFNQRGLFMGEELTRFKEQLAEFLAPFKT